ncbi:hypothetical protein BC830DRAFT_1156826 [Chytriomyces sp. MP71]|nr:hypothetical protein BC830DRAFT_1156826 [Chytriomyces sp. MP71]
MKCRGNRFFIGSPVVLKAAMNRERGIVARPPNRLAEWLPDFILLHCIEPSLPDAWNQRLNIACLIPMVVLFALCIRERRWVPSQWRCAREVEAAMVTGKVRGGSLRRTRAWIPPASVCLFWIMLLVHSLYYIVELDSTQMIYRNQAVAWHHYFSLLVFFGYASNANILCITTLLPFLIHILYWAFLYEDAPHNLARIAVLVAYNFSLLFCGSVALAQYFVLSTVPLLSNRQVVRTLPAGLIMPITSMSIAACNHAVYCVGFGEGVACASEGRFHVVVAVNALLWSAILVGAWALLTCLVAIGIARSRWFGALVSGGEAEVLDAFTETRYLVRKKSGSSIGMVGGGRVTPVGVVWRLCGIGGVIRDVELVLQKDKSS